MFFSKRNFQKCEIRYKKVVLTVPALREFESQLSTEAQVKKYNYWAQLNRVEQDDTLRDAFPEEEFGKHKQRKKTPKPVW